MAAKRISTAMWKNPYTAFLLVTIVTKDSAFSVRIQKFSIQLFSFFKVFLSSDYSITDYSFL